MEVKEQMKYSLNIIPWLPHVEKDSAEVSHLAVPMVDNMIKCFLRWPNMQENVNASQLSVCRTLYIFI